MAKADTGVKLSPGDQAIVSKIAPEIANAVKNQPIQLKQLIDKSNKQDAVAAAAAAKAAGTPAPAAPGAPVPPGT